MMMLNCSEYIFEFALNNKQHKKISIDAVIPLLYLLIR